MKRIWYFIILIVLLLPIQILASDWRQVENFDNTQTTIRSEVASISCYNNNLCYALVSHNPEIKEESGPQLFKSTDRGLTWFKIYHLKDFDNLWFK